MAWLITMLVIGLVTGWLMGSLTEGRGPGTVGKVIAGVVGSFLGGFLFARLVNDWLARDLCTSPRYLLPWPARLPYCSRYFDKEISRRFSWIRGHEALLLSDE